MPIKISSGKFGKDTQMSNYLYEARLKFPDISEILTIQDKKYNTDFIVNAFSGLSELPLGENSTQWFVQGRLQDPIYATGTYSGLGTNFSIFTVEFNNNDTNKNYVLITLSGVQIVTLDGGTKTAGGYTYTCKIAAGTTSTVCIASDFAAGAQLGNGWSVFPEKSKTGYGGLKFPDEYTNITSISRRAISISGSALTDVIWLSIAGQKFWYFKQERDMEATFKYEREKKLKYARNNVDPATGQILTQDVNGMDLPQGDGYVAQIEGINVDTYSGQLQWNALRDFIYSYKDVAGLVDGDEIMVQTGTYGYREFERCAQDFWAGKDGNSSILRQDQKGGESLILGNMYKRFYIAGIHFHLVFNPVMDDRQFFPNLTSQGYPKESLVFDFINLKSSDGQANIQRMVKSGAGINRGFIAKSVPGMVNPHNQLADVISNSIDAYERQWLSEELLKVADPKSCARLIPVNV